MMSTNNLGILACAGAGKTYHICDEVIRLHSPALLITYTLRGKEAIEDTLRMLNHGVVPSFVTVETWYSFLLREIIKPYQTAFFETIFPAGTTILNRVHSIDFSETYGQRLHGKRGSLPYYFNQNDDVRQNQVSELASHLMALDSVDILHRLHSQFEAIYFDEAQDLIGSDIQLIRQLVYSPIKIVLVGDPKQSSYATHNARQEKRQLSGRLLGALFQEFHEAGVMDLRYLQQSRRFGNSIAQFANQVDPSLPLMKGFEAPKPSTDHMSVFIIAQRDLSQYTTLYHPTFLTYNKTSRHLVPDGQAAFNFKESKGLTFDRVVLIANGPLLKFLSGKSLQSPTSYYIAVTRAKYSVGIVVENVPKSIDAKLNIKVWHLSAQ